MLKANRTTDGGIPIGVRYSDFKIITSANREDFQPVDLAGARQVAFKVGAGTMDGWLMSEPVFGIGRQFPLLAGEIPLVTKSNDDRLYFVSDSATTASNLYVWVIY